MWHFLTINKREKNFPLDKFEKGNSIGRFTPDWTQLKKINFHPCKMYCKTRKAHLTGGSPSLESWSVRSRFVIGIWRLNKMGRERFNWEEKERKESAGNSLNPPFILFYLLHLTPFVLGRELLLGSFDPQIWESVALVHLHFINLRKLGPSYHHQKEPFFRLASFPLWIRGRNRMQDKPFPLNAQSLRIPKPTPPPFSP